MKLSGFSLFLTGPGRWQFSYREQGEDGWIVHVGYPDDKAQEILKLVGELIPEPPKSTERPAAVLDGKLNLRPKRQRIML